jgi:exonuclease SbcD
VTKYAVYVKIVHTADIHLSANHPERLGALEEVLELCEEESADLLLVTGDLFDSNVNVEDLKADLRPMFSDNSFETLLIPGNHDRSAFRQEDHFGKNIQLLDGKPHERKAFDDVNIVALPYTDKDFSQLVDPLSEATVKDKKNILMIHCTLAGNQGGFGNESEYLPVKPEELVLTGFDYVLAGHIHSSAIRKTFGETVFAYSGSPVSISSSETGKREAWILDTEEGMETRELDTFHYLRQEKELLPGEEEEKEQQIIEKLEEKDLEKTSVVVELSGFTEKPVEELSESLKEKIMDLGPEKIDIRISGLESASSIVDSKIYKEFSEKMKEKSFENPELVEEKFLKGLSRYER